MVNSSCSCYGKVIFFSVSSENALLFSVNQDLIGNVKSYSRSDLLF